MWCSPGLSPGSKEPRRETGPAPWARGHGPPLVGKQHGLYILYLDQNDHTDSLSLIVHVHSTLPNGQCGAGQTWLPYLGNK